MRTALAIVFCGGAALLAVRAAHVHIADTYLDPIGKVDAQDEVMYASNALHMAQRGDWMTPVYQGRYGLYKPPLLAWMAGAAAKIAGASAFVLRLPVILFAAFTACLVFLGSAGHGPARPAAGAAAALLLISDRLWFVLSSLCLTDGLLAAFITASAFCLIRDPRLESRVARWGFTLATAAAVMVKSVAGILPVLMLLSFRVLAKPAERPRRRRIAGVLLGAVALAAPWGIYQLSVHPRWFWSEFVLSEIFTYGLSSPIQTTQENQALFYVKRLFLMDPVLTLLAPAAIPALWRAWRAREATAAVLVAWLAVVLAAAFAWSYRNVTYLAPAIPALAILAARALPARAVLAVAAAALVGKAAAPGEPWSIELHPGILHPSVALLDDYARFGRGRELILVDPFDGFYSSVLPLPRVRYCFVSPTGVPPQGPFDLHALGIVVSADEFARMGELAPRWLARLRQWGLNSSEPLATAIVARSRDEVERMIAARPSSDFLLPESYRGSMAAHVASESAGGFVLALAAPQPPAEHGQRATGQ